MFRCINFCVGLLMLAVLANCDRVPLTAPTNSSVTIEAGSRVVPTGGSTTITATVIESSGTPVQNGTTVRFSTTLGRVDPVEAQTRNGIATTTFFAGDDSGIAEVRATSGGAGGGGGTTTPPPSGGNGDANSGGTTNPNSNVVQIAVGSGAVDTVTVRANPSSVSTGAGATVSVIATVVGAGGRLLSNIPVSFSASRGQLSATSALTDAQGEARVTLTTNGDTDITVAAGTKTATAKITGVPGPAVSLTCAAGTANTCATVSVGQTVVFTAQRAQGSGNLTSAVLDFGDNTSQHLGTLSSAATVPHTYTQAGTYTARLTGTDGSGESSSSVQVIQVSAVTGSVSASVTSGTTVSATATVPSPVTQYAWSWGDMTSDTTTTSATASHTYAAPGTYTITVVATLQAGGTVTANTVIVVP